MTELPVRKSKLKLMVITCVGHKPFPKNPPSIHQKPLIKIATNLYHSKVGLSMG